MRDLYHNDTLFIAHRRAGSRQYNGTVLGADNQHYIFCRFRLDITNLDEAQQNLFVFFCFLILDLSFAAHLFIIIIIIIIIITLYILLAYPLLTTQNIMNTAAEIVLLVRLTTTPTHHIPFTT